jgi:hypothetical protein
MGASTGAYLLGLIPPELVAKLNLELPYLKRDPHWFVPTESVGMEREGSARGKGGVKRR